MGKIRDFFFPMIDKLSKDEIDKERERCHRIEKEIMEYKVKKDEAELMLKLADDYEKREDGRLHDVESKATVFIGTFSVAVTILMNLLKDFSSGSSSGVLSAIPSWLGTLISFLLGVAIFYLCFAIINSVRTLQKNTFSAIGVGETLNAGLYASILIETNKESNMDSYEHFDNKRAEIAKKKLLYTFKNENVINRKVDHMTLAQDFFMHAVVVLILMLILLVGYFVWQQAGDQIADVWSKIVAVVESFFRRLRML